jgi:hypothetical protein
VTKIRIDCKEGNPKAMSSAMEEHPRSMSLAVLAEQCLREINAVRRDGAGNDQYWVELLRRATVQRDDAAHQILEHHLSQVVRAWLYCHPKMEVACRLASEASYVTRTCERFWQAAAQQEQALDRLVTALRYVGACLNSVILDTLRADAYATAIPLPEPAGAGKAGEEDHEDARACWERIRGMLPTARERRVAYLLFHCGLQPEDIVRLYPQELGERQDISHVRRTVIGRLLASGITSAPTGQQVVPEETMD